MAERDEEESTTAGAHILVVEDEPLVRDLVALNLRHAGYQVTTAATWPEGLAAIMRAPLELALVDVMLPGGDGMELVAKARAAGVSCPVLMLTARGETAAKVRGLDSGADDYMAKPFDVPELSIRELQRWSFGQALGRHLEGRRRRGVAGEIDRASAVTSGFGVEVA